MKNHNEELPGELANSIPLDDFVALKPPKRGAARESLPNAANSLRRGYIDLVAATEESLRAGWRYGCWLFNNCCYICGESFKLGEQVQADHVIPPELGGSTNAGNMLPAHSRCNDLKGNKDPEVFFAARPEVLKLLKHFRDKFNFSPDLNLYPLALERISTYMDMIKQDILRSRSARELERDDLTEETTEVAPPADSPLVNNLMKAVTYYLEHQEYAPSAKAKMTSHSRRILRAWEAYCPGEDLFTQDEAVVKSFMDKYFLRISDHSDSFNRAHRAFRLLGVVFTSSPIATIYSEGAPLRLADLRETHYFDGARWRHKEKLRLVS